MEIARSGRLFAVARLLVFFFLIRRRKNGFAVDGAGNIILRIQRHDFFGNLQDVVEFFMSEIQIIIVAAFIFGRHRTGIAAGRRYGIFGKGVDFGTQAVQLRFQLFGSGLDFDHGIVIKLKRFLFIKFVDPRIIGRILQEQLVNRRLNGIRICDVYRTVFGKPFGAGNFFGGIFTFGKIRSKTRFEGSHLFFGIFYRFVRRGLNLFQNRRDRRRRITEEVERNPGHQLSVGGRTEAKHSRNQQDSEIKFFIFSHLFHSPLLSLCWPDCPRIPHRPAYWPTRRLGLFRCSG